MRTYFCSIPTERTHKASLLRVPFNRRMPAAHRISLVHLLQRGKTLSPPPWDQGEAGKYCPNQDLNPRPLNPESIVTTAYLRHLSPQRLTPDTLCSSTHHPALSHKVLSHQFRCLPITCCPNPTKICLPFNISLRLLTDENSISRVNGLSGKGLKGNPHQDAGWHERNWKCANVSICTLWSLTLFYTAQVL